MLPKREYQIGMSRKTARLVFKEILAHKNRSRITSCTYCEGRLMPPSFFRVLSSVLKMSGKQTSFLKTINLKLSDIRLPDNFLL